MEKRKRQTYKVESIMIKKRFTWKTEKLQHLNEEVLLVVDNANKDWKGHILNVVDLLNQLHQENEHLIIGNKNLMKKNEQLQKRNKFLEEDVDDYHNALFDLHKKYDKLEKENEQLRQFINKGRRLSVKELMNNVNENESLKKKIKKLEKENEQLRKELIDCEKFRYQIFKRVGALNDE